MFIKQIYTSCLSQASYYVESDGESIIIDPIRDSKIYEDLVFERGSKVKYIFETHFHADFISGHLDLKNIFNSEIVFGSEADTNYEITKAANNSFFNVGSIKIKVLHTPGHTPESVCYLLLDKNNNEYCVFTGDTLFIGEVGRPDLAVSSSVTERHLAAQLFDSLHNILMKLNDNVIVYPAHGPGSACGKNFSNETFSTIGEQKKNNYALQKMTKEEFIKVVLEGILAAPKYFSHDAKMNKEGYLNTSEIIERNLKKFNEDDIEKEISKGTIILDVRSGLDFENGHIKSSINITKTSQTFATWVGAVIPVDKNLIIVCYPGEQKEVISRLARVGFENVIGYLEDISEVAPNLIDSLDSIYPEQMFTSNFSDAILLDVRKPMELEQVGKIKKSINIRLQELPDRVCDLNLDKKYLVYCAGGYRSMIASSILKARNFKSVYNIYGGFNSIKKFL